MGKKVNGRWIYTIPKVVYVELHGSEPLGEVYLTRRAAVKFGIGGKIVKFMPATEDRTYDGGPVLKSDDGENYPSVGEEP